MGIMLLRRLKNVSPIIGLMLSGIPRLGIIGPPVAQHWILTGQFLGRTASLADKALVSSPIRDDSVAW